MWRSGSIPVVKVAGITVEVHLTFFIVAALGAWQGWRFLGGVKGALYGILGIVILFGAVLAHEIGHGLQARWQKLMPGRIILLPVGGLAYLGARPVNAWQELIIALSGPLANLAIALILAGGMYVIAPGGLLAFRPSELAFLPGSTLFISYSLWVNAALFFFNMLPVFPMDGGTIIRAALASPTGYLRATQLVAWLGWLSAAGFIMYTVLWRHLFSQAVMLMWLALSAIVLLGSWQEAQAVYQRRRLLEITVGEQCRKPAVTFAPWEMVTLEHTRELLRRGQAIPVVSQTGQIVGLVPFQAVRRRPDDRSPVTIAHIMTTTFPALRPDETLWAALREIERSSFETLPVVSGNTFIGVISIDDIKQAMRGPQRRR
nr:CBS domain-containing protein [Anaerolineae bacterium]